MLSVVIPIYDPWGKMERMTKSALDRLFTFTTGEYEAVAVLNGPVTWRMDGDPQTKVVQLPKRVSIAKAYNEGAKHGIGDFIVNLHNDCFVNQGWNLPMEREALKDRIAFPVVDESEGNCVFRGIAHAPEWMPPGCCFMMTRQMWNDLGGYDERYEGLHWEDTDLFYRATKKGIPLVQCSTTVIHWRAMTRTSLEDDGEECMLANKKRFKEKFAEDVRYGTWEYPRLCNVDSTKKYIEDERRYVNVRNS